jgi:protein gp37
MQKSKIEWADMVFNPTTGCTKVSAGCKNCYAESIAKRFWGDRPFTDVQCHYNRLEDPLKVKKPQMVFVDSMSDLFHKDVPFEFIDRVFETMHLAYWHTFIILTKRHVRMCAYMQTHYKPGGFAVLPNVWPGVSVENQATADERIPLLLQTPAAKRIVSIEPMLEAVNPCRVHDRANQVYYDALGGSRFDYDIHGFGVAAPMPIKLDWILCGGESGKNARPSPSVEDVRYLKDQCVEAGVPFFLKQLNGVKMPLLDGRVWDQKPERSR